MSSSDYIPLNDLSRWDPTDKLRVKAAISRVVNSGYFINGPITNEFNELFKRSLNERELVFVGNGTDALVLGLLGLGIKKGEVVATVSNAGGYATGAILRVGAIPLLVDVHLNTAQMSADDLRQKMESSPPVKAVIVTHLYGLMAEMSEITLIAKEFGCLLIEDCAQSIGAVQGGVVAGTFGDASTFSFYPTKNLSGLGDGGAISFKDQDCASLAQRYAQYGWSARYKIDLNGGMNSRIDEIQAAVLSTRLMDLQRNNEVRRKIVGRYQSVLSDSQFMIFQQNESFVGHLAVLVAKSRDHVVKRMESAKIATAIHYPVLDHHQVGWRSNFQNVVLPSSEELVQRIISLPCFPLMTELEIERVSSVLQSL
jgi:dTDP-4-amino-4,6-dideoxygalactose transaminase